MVISTSTRHRFAPTIKQPVAHYFPLCSDLGLQMSWGKGEGVKPAAWGRVHISLKLQEEHTLSSHKVLKMDQSWPEAHNTIQWSASCETVQIWQSGGFCHFTIKETTWRLRKASSFPGDRAGPNTQNIYKEDLGSKQPSSVAGIAAWQVKLLRAMLVSHMGV